MVDRKYTTRPGPPQQPEDDGAWFAEKTYGYGAGLPIRWQGWTVLAAYVAALAPIGLLDRMHGAAPRIAAFVLLILSTVALVQVCRKKTRGGWKWRWGGE